MNRHLLALGTDIKVDDLGAEITRANLLVLRSCRKWRDFEDEERQTYLGKLAILTGAEVDWVAACNGLRVATGGLSSEARGVISRSRVVS